MGILIAQFLGPEGKGLFYLLLASTALCTTVGDLGLGSASIYLISKDRKYLPAAVGNAFAITCAVGAFVGIFGWLFLQYGRPDLYVQLPAWMWIVAAFLVPLHLLRDLLTQVLYAMLRIKEVNLLEVTAIASHLFLTVVFFVMLGWGFGGALLAVALPDSLVTIGFFLLVLRYGGRPAKPNLALFRASLRYGVKTYLAQLMRLLNLRLDAFLLTTLTVGGVYATGIYSVTTGLAELLLFVPQSIRPSLFPMVAAGGVAEANRLTSVSCRHTLLLTAFLALGLAVVGPFVIPQLYGEVFTGAVIPLWILLPGVVMLSQARIIYSYLNGCGKPGATTISSLFSLVITVLLDFILIPKYGIIGAALASSCAYAIEFIVAAYLFIHYSPSYLKEVFVLQRSDFYYYRKIFSRLIRQARESSAKLLF
jgi:stage V sporulation protein B